HVRPPCECGRHTALAVIRDIDRVPVQTQQPGESLGGVNVVVDDQHALGVRIADGLGPGGFRRDRKSTRLSSSHEWISYAVFCLKKKKKEKTLSTRTRKGILRRSKGTRAYTTDERGGQV